MDYMFKVYISSLCINSLCYNLFILVLDIKYVLLLLIYCFCDFYFLFIDMFLIICKYSCICFKRFFICGRMINWLYKMDGNLFYVLFNEGKILSKYNY